MDNKDLDKQLKDVIVKSNKVIDEKIKKRQEYNYKCLEILKEVIEKYPDWRFTQIIFNLGLAEDRFYMESVDTYYFMEKTKRMCGIIQ